MARITRKYFKADDTLSMIGGAFTDLFLRSYPRLTVFRDTVDPGENQRGIAILASCVLCMCEYYVGEKVYTLPCGSTHTFHVSCFAKMLETARSTASQYSPVRSAKCPLCRTIIPLYERLKYRERVRCRVALGEISGTNTYTEFAALSKEEWRVTGQAQFLPTAWGNRRRFIHAEYLHYTDSKPALPKYYVGETLTPPESPDNSICLRTNRERLCEMPCVSALKEYLSVGMPDSKRSDLIKLYVLGDVVNAIYVPDPDGTFVHLYIQARVNCGGVAWFGFREFRNYILGLQGVRERIRWIEFHNELDRFARSHNRPGFYHLANLNREGTHVKSFDRKNCRAPSRQNLRDVRRNGGVATREPSGPTARPAR
ncbi:hypothetical protein TWF481_006205 [Arthrobotrys musiformis]|uniref:RING-type domain-containing protein n=1 Tax=Arthrobotrys musiformis TaxID=47236 RepID=A0AAV9WG21_9PEZI